MTETAYTMNILTFEDGNQQIHWFDGNGNRAAAIIPNGNGELFDITWYDTGSPVTLSRRANVTLHDAIGLIATTFARREQ